MHCLGGWGFSFRGNKYIISFVTFFLVCREGKRKRGEDKVLGLYDTPFFIDVMDGVLGFI